MQGQVRPLLMAGFATTTQAGSNHARALQIMLHLPLHDQLMCARDQLNGVRGIELST